MRNSIYIIYKYSIYVLEVDEHQPSIRGRLRLELVELTLRPSFVAQVILFVHRSYVDPKRCNAPWTQEKGWNTLGRSTTLVTVFYYYKSEYFVCTTIRTRDSPAASSV